MAASLSSIKEHVVSPDGEVVMLQLQRMTEFTARPRGGPTRHNAPDQRYAPQDDEASIRAAMRTTLWFVAILTILLWAGVVQASPDRCFTTVCVPHASIDVPPASSPTLR